jgi:non-canonical poly(A) RNA polymerase PAPD5/7
MLCLRDPADETNDLGRKAVAIKHVQTTFRKLYFDLDRNMMMNTCPSLLAPLVGPSYMLNKERREKLRHYGYTLSDQMRKSLAATAKMVRDREDMEEANKQDKEAMDKAQLVR